MGYPVINKDYMQTKYNVTKCVNRRKNKAVRYIVVHYTGTNASAKNNCIYFGSGDRQASADYFIDVDGSIYKFNANCAGYYSWHCGDGAGKYGITNANSIGIECVSAGSEFSNAQKKSLAALVQAIMSDYGVSKSNVVRHYDASRKLCPAPYCGNASKNGKWSALKAYITGASGGAGVVTSGSAGSSKKSLGNVTISYALKTLGGGWLSTVKNFGSGSNGFAGWPNKSHAGFWAKVSKGSIKYRVHVVGGSWGKWYKDGIKVETSKAIDGIQLYYTTPEGYEYKQVWYRSQTVKRSGYLDVCCDDGTSNAAYDGWAGILGEPLDRLQCAISDANPF